PTIIRQLFNEDRIEFLTKKYKKVIKWCDATLVKAYHLKFACGLSGYKELLHQGFPLPSIRTLNRTLEKLKFRKKILSVYELLRIKVSQFSNSKDKDYVIILDEISISPDVFLDTSTFTSIRNVSKFCMHTLLICRK
ncbi:hypothetical protein ALC57_00597, partial [Trachymyrmex cornetzi]